MTSTTGRDSARRLSFGQYIGYGVGDFAFNFYWLPLQVFLLKYYTDVLGLGSGLAGTVIMVCLVWDGMIDPAIGIIANKTRTRWGRYRPYLLFGCVPLAVSFTLLFVPVSLKDTSLVIYVLATQLLFRTLYAAVNIPYGAMMASMTRDSMERNWLAGARMLFAYSGSAVVGYYTPRLVEYFSGVSGAYAYFAATAILSICAIAVIVLCFAMTTELVSNDTPQEKHPSLAAMLTMIASNVPFLQVIAAIALFYFANVVIYSSLAYFIQYFMGQEQKVTGNVVGMIPLVQMIAIMPWTIASRYLGKRWAWIGGLSIATAGLLALYSIDHPSMEMVYFLIGVYAVGSASIGVNLWSIVPDTVEYGEWRSGVRAEGFIFGFLTLIQKVALGLSSAFVGAYLAHIGYVANQAQSGATLGSLKVLITAIAGLGLVASCAVMYFYRLSAATHGQMVREIAARQSLQGPA